MVTTHILARFRMAGLSSMAGYLSIADANAVTLVLGKRDIIPVVKNVPVMAGLLGTEPTREMDSFLDEIIAAGFSGLLNCPTIACTVMQQFPIGMPKLMVSTTASGDVSGMQGYRDG